MNADDVQLVIKLQKRVKDLELTKSRLRSELDDRDDDDDELTKFQITTPEFAYNNLKVYSGWRVLFTVWIVDLYSPNFLDVVLV